MEGIREPRLIIFWENYCSSLLCITNLSNDMLQNLLKQYDKNIEDSIGRSFEEILDNWIEEEKIDNYAMFKELGTTEDSDYEEIKDLDSDCVASCSDFGFNVVNSRV